MRRFPHVESYRTEDGEVRSRKFSNISAAGPFKEIRLGGMPAPGRRYNSAGSIRNIYDWSTRGPLLLGSEGFIPLRSTFSFYSWPAYRSSRPRLGPRSPTGNTGFHCCEKDLAGRAAREGGTCFVRAPGSRQDFFTGVSDRLLQIEGIGSVINEVPLETRETEDF